MADARFDNFIVTTIGAAAAQDRVPVTASQPLTIQWFPPDTDLAPRFDQER